MKTHQVKEEDGVDPPMRQAGEEVQAAWLRPPSGEPLAVPALCWPFPPGSQNQTDKAVKLKPYAPPKRRSLNQY